MTGREVVITEWDFDKLMGLLRTQRNWSSQGQYFQALEQELHRGRVVPPKKVPKGIVTMNSRVRIRDEALDETSEYILVYPGEADIDQGKLSVLAPMGTALLGARVGEVVEWQAPAGARRAKVVKVVYQPEAAGDYHL